MIPFNFCRKSISIITPQMNVRLRLSEIFTRCRTYSLATILTTKPFTDGIGAGSSIREQTPGDLFYLGIPPFVSASGFPLYLLRRIRFQSVMLYFFLYFCDSIGYSKSPIVIRFRFKPPSSECQGVYFFDIQ